MMPSPSPVCVSPPTAVSKLELDINGLQKILQQIDESFHVSDDDVDRKLRLQHLERQQEALQQLCDVALRQQDAPMAATMPENVGVQSTVCRMPDADVVSTPRSIDTFSPLHGAREMQRGVACNSETRLRSPKVSLFPPPRLFSPSRAPSASVAKVSGPVREGRGTLDGNCAAASRFVPLRSPEAPTAHPGGGVLKDDHDLVESFLVSELDSPEHPYAMEGKDASRGGRGSTGGWCRQGLRSQRGGRYRGLLAPRPTSVDDRIASPEYFDVGEDEKLLRLLTGMSDAGVGAAANGARAASCPGVAAGRTQIQSEAASAGKMSRLKTGAPSTTTAATSVAQFPHGESRTLSGDSWARGRGVKELALKAECLARHLVKSMRDRTQLQYRVDRLEGMLDVANAEVGRLKRVLEQREDGVLTESAWRASINAKERELRICEDEIRRLRIIVEQQMARQGGMSSRQGGSTALRQARGDMDYMMQELGIAHMRRRETEAELDCAKRALDAAESHIQVLDRRLVQLERSAVLAQLRDVSSCPGMRAADLPPALRPTAPVEVPSGVGLGSCHLVENIDEWPRDAQQAMARLTSRTESLVLKHAESDRHAELRLSNACKENEALRKQCAELKTEIGSHEAEVEALRRDHVAAGLREGQLRQQLLDLRDDAALLSDLLQTATKSAKGVLQGLREADAENGLSGAAIERFVANMLCDFDAFGRFFVALQCMDTVEPQQREERLPVSDVTVARRDFVLKAVDEAMARSPHGLVPVSSRFSMPPFTQAPLTAEQAHAPQVARERAVNTTVRLRAENKSLAAALSPTPSTPHSASHWDVSQGINPGDAATPEAASVHGIKEEVEGAQCSTAEGYSGHKSDWQGNTELYTQSLTNTDTEPRISLLAAVSWPSPQCVQGSSAPSAVPREAGPLSTRHANTQGYSSTGLSLPGTTDISGAVMSEGTPRSLQQLLQSHALSRRDTTERNSEEESSGPVLTATTPARRHNNAPSTQMMLQEVDGAETGGAATVVLSFGDEGKGITAGTVGGTLEVVDENHQMARNEISASMIVHPMYAGGSNPKGGECRSPCPGPRSSKVNAPRAEREDRPIGRLGRRPAVEQAAGPVPLRRTGVGVRKMEEGVCGAIALVEPQRHGNARLVEPLQPRRRELAEDPHGNGEFLSLRQPVLGGTQVKVGE